MKKRITQKQLDILYECWKEGENTKERLKIIEERLPEVSPLIALSKMRRMEKTDDKWKKMVTRKKNLKEKEKEDKRAEKEKKKTERVTKKAEKEKKKLEKNREKEHEENLQSIRDNIKKTDMEKISKKIGSEFIFCSDVSQYINIISCIYRFFSNEYTNLIDNRCIKCPKMHKYISIMEGICKIKENQKK